MIPTHNSPKTFFAEKRNATTAAFNVYSGFADYVDMDGMDLLCQLVIPNLPTNTGSNLRFEVTMDVDESGMLQLKVEFVENGETKTLMKEARFDNERPEEDFEILKAHLQNYWP